MKTALKPRSARKTPFVFGLALSCSLMAGSAGAQWVVTDPGNTLQAVMNQINTYMAKIQDATQYVKEVNHMRQQLTDISMIFDSFQLKFTQDFKKKSLTDGMSDRCGGGIGSIISDLMSSISLSGDEDIVQQQKMICQRIVMLENQKFNDQVDYLNAIMNQMQADIDQAKRQARSSNTNGKEGTNLVMTHLSKSQQDANIEQAKARSEAFDEMIGALETQQKNLARIAMNGKSSIVGTIANTLILKGALELNK